MMNRLNLGFYLHNEGTESSQISSKKVFICVPKMNKSLTDLERHEGEYLMTKFSFSG